MKKKETKKKINFSKQTSATFVLSFTMMFFLITMYMATSNLGTSFAAGATATSSIPTTLNFSGTVMTMPADKWHFASDELVVGFDFKATDPSTSTQYEMYCIEGQKGVSASDTYTNPTAMSSTYSTGMAWLLNNADSFLSSYSFTSTAEKKYVTQFAIWKYLDNFNHDQLDADQRNALAVANNYTNAINALANAAISNNNSVAAQVSIDNSKIKYSIEGDYIVSNDIAVSTNKRDSMLNYVVTITGEDAEIVGGTFGGVSATSKVYSFSNPSNTFKIKVPLAKVTDSDSYSLSVSVTGVFGDTVYEYQSSSGAQRPIISVLGTSTASINLTIPMVKITKSDITDGKPVKGATLEIKDCNGNLIDSWITDDTPHYVTLKPNSDSCQYTLSETTSPDGYELNTETIAFTVKADGTITKVEMKNTPTTPVENTATNIPLYLYIIGGMIIAIGAVAIYMTVKPVNKAKK